MKNEKTNPYAEKGQCCRTKNQAQQTEKALSAKETDPENRKVKPPGTSRLAEFAKNQEQTTTKTANSIVQKVKSSPV